jgi:diacylglycerol kinase family enzyme
LRIGFISNTHSGRNRKSLAEIRALLDAQPTLLHREVRYPEQVAEALEEFSRAKVDVIALNGGDGTIQAAVTCLYQQPLFERMPLLALLPGGTTNMTAYDISGGRRKLLPSIHRLLRGARAGGDWRVIERPILRVRPAPGEEPLYGFFFGAGAIIRGMEYFHARIRTKGLKNELGPGLTLLRFVYGILRGDPGFAGSQPISAGLDGIAPGQADNTLLLFVSTLDRFFLGMRPYWGKEPEPLHFTRILEKPQRLLRVLPSIIRGRPNRHVSEAAGYHSHNALTVRLIMDGRFSLDGELHEASAERGAVEIESAGRVRFICL